MRDRKGFTGIQVKKKPDFVDQAFNIQKVGTHYE